VRDAVTSPPPDAATPERSADELQRIRERYARRSEQGLRARYAPLQPENLYAAQRRAWHWARLLRGRGQLDLVGARVLEVGCGTGAVLQQLTTMGASVGRLYGVELLTERCRAAAESVPGAAIVRCDGGHLPFVSDCMDLVVQSTAFSSILDAKLQERLAAEMLRVLRPGGAILWCDLAIDNPANPDVRAVSARRLRELFPQAHIRAHRGILALPLLRRLRWGIPRVALLLESVPLLCGHLLACIEVSAPVARRRSGATARGGGPHGPDA
jgi:SAM-dependent methyltransferase